MTPDPTHLFGTIIICGIIILFARGIALWYYKIDERITQQHETNRLLRKLAGEQEIGSVYLEKIREKNIKEVSSAEEAAKSLPKKDDSI
jgi:virulence-associated protein VapD